MQQKERQIQEDTALRERWYLEDIVLQERQLQQLNQQLEEQEQVTAEIQQTNHSTETGGTTATTAKSANLKPLQPSPPSEAQVRGRQLQESEALKQSLVQPSLQVDHKPHLHSVRKIILNWRDGGKAPFKLHRGAAVVNGVMWLTL